MKRAAAIALWWIPLWLLVDARTDSRARIADATQILQVIVGSANGAVPQEALQNARCIGTLSWATKARFRFGHDYGEGVVVCRTRQGWSAPSLIHASGETIALQLDVGETEVVIIAKNRNGEQELMQDRFSVGSSSKTADILFYPRFRGTSYGINLRGLVLTPDETANSALYGRFVTQKKILEGNVPAPAIASALYEDLAQCAAFDEALATSRSADRHSNDKLSLVPLPFFPAF